MAHRILPAALACLFAWAGARAETPADAFHQVLRNAFPAEPLRWNAMQNEHIIATELNGQAADFVIDTGAARSVISHRAALRLGLALTDPRRSQPGIGGNESFLTTTADTLRLGRSIDAGRRTMQVLAMPQAASDGLLGNEILTGAGALIDHREHLLLVRKGVGEPPDLADEAGRHGMVVVPLERDGFHHFATLQHGDHDLRFLLDTGSQQSVLDEGAAKRLGLTVVGADIRAAGTGRTARNTHVTSIDRLDLAGVALRKTAMLVMPVADFGKASERPFDGILGAEFLFGAGAVFDVAGDKLYLPPGDLDIRSYAKTGGEMLASDAELARLYQNSGWVGGVKVARFTIETEESRLRSPDPQRTAARLDIQILEVIKNDDRFPPGSSHTLTILFPHRDGMRDWVAGVLGRNPRKLLFLPPDPSPALPLAWERTLFTDGALPRAQIRRIRQTPEPP